MILVHATAREGVSKETRGTETDLAPALERPADGINETREKALAKGVSAFVSKPMQASDLHRALQACGL